MCMGSELLLFFVAVKLKIGRWSEIPKRILPFIPEFNWARSLVKILSIRVAVC